MDIRNRMQNAIAALEAALGTEPEMRERIGQLIVGATSGNEDRGTVDTALAMYADFRARVAVKLGEVTQMDRQIAAIQRQATGCPGCPACDNPPPALADLMRQVQAMLDAPAPGFPAERPLCEKRLQFARFLVLTGKISDEYPVEAA